MRKLLLALCLLSTACGTPLRGGNREALITEGWWAYSDHAIVIVRDPQTQKRFICATGGYVLEIKP